MIGLEFSFIPCRVTIPFLYGMPPWKFELQVLQHGKFTKFYIFGTWFLLQNGSIQYLIYFPGWSYVFQYSFASLHPTHWWLVVYQQQRNKRIELLWTPCCSLRHMLRGALAGEAPINITMDEEELKALNQLLESLGAQGWGDLDGKNLAIMWESYINKHETISNSLHIVNGRKCQFSSVVDVHPFWRRMDSFKW